MLKVLIQTPMAVLLAGLLALPFPTLAQNTAQGTVQPEPQAAGSGSSVSVEGVSFEREIQLGGSTLKLNGAGVRTRIVFKVYAAALYMPVPSTTSTDVYMSKGPKRLKVSFLREIDSTTLGKTMSQVMSDNLPREQFGKCIPGIVKLGELFADKKKMTAGEMFTVDEMPGKGTVISINGKLAAEISEPEFFTCLMHNYFGDRPADAKLKTALLGGK
ncbi:hypothetical protein CHU94_14780 [Rhodoferax sp. TH121]|uniref:chalcone isomerase family protein n=1 Tax=Rhodoferax sp. TH121 TaxID=2022803 RepID=UPI000B97A885|nr:chalcone isomerase family protein [Rhodoferax sp. TH121]OYQ38708.1 hypothetical protein CHU94_14780 [Rhodoferax sp. TH121]